MSNFEILAEVEPYFISVVEKTTPGKPSVVEFGFATKLTQQKSSPTASISDWRDGLMMTLATLGSHIPSARGYFALWHQGRPVGLNHPKAQSFLKDHGLSMDDFHPPVTASKPGARMTVKVRRIKQDRLITSPFVQFSEQAVGRDGKPQPGKFRVVARAIQPTLSLADLEINELQDLALANNVNLGRSTKKETILKKLQDAGVTL